MLRKNAELQNEKNEQKVSSSTQLIFLAIPFLNFCGASEVTSVIIEHSNRFSYLLTQYHHSALKLLAG